MVNVKLLYSDSWSAAESMCRRSNQAGIPGVFRENGGEVASSDSSCGGRQREIVRWEKINGVRRLW